MQHFAVTALLFGAFGASAVNADMIAYEASVGNLSGVSVWATRVLQNSSWNGSVQTIGCNNIALVDNGSNFSGKAIAAARPNDAQAFVAIQAANLNGNKGAVTGEAPEPGT
jgi:hypothetical protein